MRIRRILAAAAALLMLASATAAAQMEIALDLQQEQGNSLAVFFAQMTAAQDTPQEELLAQSMKLFEVNALIEERFSQARAATVFESAKLRGEAMIRHEVYGSADETYWSAARVWTGEQASGRSGSSAASLMIDLTTGKEIPFDALFADPQAAAEHMEAIIARDVLDGMSDYMEYADLLPMPRDCFAVTGEGLVVFWPEDRYRYFNGDIGSVTFGWHELDAFIGEDSPVYAVSRPDAADAEAIRTFAAQGRFAAEDALALGVTLSELQALLADPDYTTVSMVYPLERVRGMAVEIDKYAETDEEATPVSAIRMSNTGWHGLVTRETTREEIIALLGEPQSAQRFDGDAAFDMLLEPGESLYYTMGEKILQAHLDGEGVLSCLILREEIPQTLL